MRQSEGKRQSFRSWITAYENSRVNPYDEMSWLNSSTLGLDLQGLSWEEIQQTPIEGLWDGANIGNCWSALKKTWPRFKEQKKNGFFDSDMALRILRIQKALGLPLSKFPEFERYGDGWVDYQLSLDYPSTDEDDQDQGLSIEERRLNEELRREEAIEELADWGLDGLEEEEEKEDEDDW